jgi:hypothetical protein
MYGPTGLCESQDKTAVSPWIIHIVFQQFPRPHALLKFLDKNVLVFALVLGVEREFVILCPDLLADMLQNVHSPSIVYHPGRFVQLRGIPPVGSLVPPHPSYYDPCHGR